MKKIAIVTKNMDFGGVEKCLISMLNNIPESKYDITVILMNKSGKLLNQVPKWVKVIEMPNISKTTKEKLMDLIKQYRFISAIKLLYNLILSLNAKSIYASYIRYANILPKLNTEYDLAISYYNPTSFPVIYTIKNLKAKKKIMWIHSDINTYQDINNYKNIYEKYNKIFNVSNEGAKEFVKKFPDLKDKVDVFYNLIDQNGLQSLGKQDLSFNNYDSKYINILTVGRLSEEKGQDLIPGVLKKLIDNGKNVKWYLIGEGKLRTLIEKDIKRYKLEDKLILLGSKENPYPYIKNCDIYVQPSRNECYCTTVTEAKCFNIPMVITDVNGSREQINHNDNGLIVNINEEDIFKGIKILIENEYLRNKFIDNLKSKPINTLNEINKLYHLIDE